MSRKPATSSSECNTSMTCTLAMRGKQTSSGTRASSTHCLYVHAKGHGPQAYAEDARLSRSDAALSDAALPRHLPLARRAVVGLVRPRRAVLARRARPRRRRPLGAEGPLRTQHRRRRRGAVAPLGALVARLLARARHVRSRRAHCRLAHARPVALVPERAECLGRVLRPRAVEGRLALDGRGRSRRALVAALAPSSKARHWAAVPTRRTRSRLGRVCGAEGPCLARDRRRRSRRTVEAAGAAKGHAQSRRRALTASGAGCRDGGLVVAGPGAEGSDRTDHRCPKLLVGVRAVIATFATPCIDNGEGS
jgi:hypothetical protein